MNNGSTEEQLRAKGLSVTKQRLALLAALQKAKKPLSAEELSERLGSSMNQATVYRGLDQLVAAQLARRIDLKQNYALYESADHHHHHIVCRSCGRVDDVSACLPRSLHERVLAKNPQFARIEDHALEFFGLCRTCSRK